MPTAALVTWVVAALGGFYLLSVWLRKGGLRQQRSGTTRFPVGLIFGHFLLAAAGLVGWLVFVITDNGGAAWTGLVLVALAALLGFTMFARWLGGRGDSAGRTRAGGGEVAAERHLPMAAVLAHGLVAALTIVLVIVAALQA